MASERIERLGAAGVSDRDVRGLGALLVDAVDSGAAVSFLSPLTSADAEAWWRKQLASSHSGAVYLVARDDTGEIVGTVQLQPAWAPNQPHRADVCKLIVHRRVRGGGVARRLMDAIERAAWNAGFTLLVLDTKHGGGAESLYEKIGWTRVGVIPSFAVDPDGVTPHATVVFYKDLRRGRERPWREGEITIRPTLKQDLGAIYSMHVDPEACVMAGVKPRTREAFDATWDSSFADPRVIPRTIVMSRNGAAEIVGGVSLFQSECVDMVGYSVARRHWGEGIATRALRLFLDEVRQRPLRADALANNTGSIRVLERCGFRFMGTHKGEETERYLPGLVASFVLE